MDASADRLANALDSIGVQCGDRVVVIVPNCVEFLQAWRSSVSAPLRYQVIERLRKIVDPDTDEKLPRHTISEMVVRPTFRGAALCRARHRTSQDAAGQDSEAQAPEGRPYCQHLGSRGRKILHQMSLRLLQEVSPFKGQVQGKIG